MVADRGILHLHKLPRRLGLSHVGLKLAKFKVNPEHSISINYLSMVPAVTPIQRVAIPPTSEGCGYPTQKKVVNAPPVTTSINPTAPRMLQSKPCMHLWKMRNNTPRAVPPVQVLPVHPVERRSKRLNQELENDTIFTVPKAMIINSYQIPLESSNIVSQEAFNRRAQCMMDAPKFHRSKPYQPQAQL